MSPFYIATILYWRAFTIYCRYLEIILWEINFLLIISEIIISLLGNRETFPRSLIRMQIFQGGPVCHACTIGTSEINRRILFTIVKLPNTFTLGA